MLGHLSFKKGYCRPLTVVESVGPILFVVALSTPRSKCTVKEEEIFKKFHNLQVKFFLNLVMVEWEEEG